MPEGDRMLAAAICVAIPVVLLGLYLFVRSEYGDEIFGLEWPAHELNRTDDYRVIKLRLNSSSQSGESSDLHRQ